jgi:heme oxygenase (mycobilin-producing)
MPSNSPVLPTEASGMRTEDAAAAAQRPLVKPFVAISQFEVANGPEMTRRVKEAFRPGLVDRAPGFMRMDVVSPLDNPAEIWLITYWEDEASFQAWHHSHTYKDSHAGIPEGLKLVRGSFQLRFFEFVTS